MNVKNNRRRRESVEKIQKAFIHLLQTKELHQISVTDLCKETGLNRSTFYANFLDIYDLADQMKKQLETDFSAHFQNADAHNATQMFRHIYENQLFYKTYFKLGYTEENKVFVFDTKRADADFQGKHINYHIEFFRNGLNAIIRIWLENGCKEFPEEMAEILKAEYRGR